MYDMELQRKEGKGCLDDLATRDQRMMEALGLSIFPLFKTARGAEFSVLKAAATVLTDSVSNRWKRTNDFLSAYAASTFTKSRAKRQKAWTFSRNAHALCATLRGQDR